MADSPKFPAAPGAAVPPGRNRPDVGIQLAIGSLAMAEQKLVRAMLGLLATRLGAYFRTCDAREAEVILEPDPEGDAGFLLRAQGAAAGTCVRLAQPLRLGALAAGLNAMADALRPPQAVAAAAAPGPGLAGELACAPTRPRRLQGAWGECVQSPDCEVIAFDRPLDAIARALAEDARVQHAATISAEIAETLRAAAAVRLRADEVDWLCGPDAGFEREVAVKLAHPDAFLRLASWPNLARLPDHRRWIGLFARLQRGAPMAAALDTAAVEGLAESAVRRAMYRMLQRGHLQLELRPRVPPARREPAEIPSPSFMQHLRQRLHQLGESP